MAQHMIQLSMNPRALHEWTHVKSLPDSDPGYLVHCALRAAFGPDAPQPFALQARRQDQRQDQRQAQSQAQSQDSWFLPVLGYGPADEHRLRRHLQETAEPLLAEVLPAEAIHAKALPEAWPAGARYRFSLRCCPITRTREGRDNVRERDAFLAACDHHDGDEPLEREAVYLRWLEAELGRKGAARCLVGRMTAFRLLNPVRRKGGKPVHMKGRRPDATMEGLLEVQRPEAFAELMARGCGRHRAFGFGMLLLRPA